MVYLVRNYFCIPDTLNRNALFGSSLLWSLHSDRIMRNVDNFCETIYCIPNMLLILNNATVAYWNRIAKRNMFWQL